MQHVMCKHWLIAAWMLMLAVGSVRADQADDTSKPRKKAENRRSASESSKAPAKRKKTANGAAAVKRSNASRKQKASSSTQRNQKEPSSTTNPGDGDAPCRCRQRRSDASKSDALVACPQYPWAIHPSYTSYYATLHGTPCDPSSGAANLDGPHGLPLGDCSSQGHGCQPAQSLKGVRNVRRRMNRSLNKLPVLPPDNSQLVNPYLVSRGKLNTSAGIELRPGATLKKNQFIKFRRPAYRDRWVYAELLLVELNPDEFEWPGDSPKHPDTSGWAKPTFAVGYQIGKPANPKQFQEVADRYVTRVGDYGTVFRVTMPEKSGGKKTTSAAHGWTYQIIAVKPFFDR